MRKLLYFTMLLLAITIFLLLGNFLDSGLFPFGNIEKIKSAITASSSELKERITAASSELKTVIVSQSDKTRQEIIKNRDEIFENRLEGERNKHAIINTLSTFGWFIILIAITGFMLVLFTLFFGFYMLNRRGHQNG